MVRGSGKFKQKRGGGRNFSKNMVLDENGTAVSTDKPRRSRRDDASDDEEDSEGEAEEESEEESGEESGGEDKPELTRAERRDLKKKQAAAKQQTEGDEEDADLINPNHVMKKMNISDLGAKEPTRREREQKEKQDAKDRYWKLHLAGKTDQAKADLARLAKIRAEREVANAKRQAEAEAKAAEAALKKAAQEGRGSSRT